MSQFKGSQGGHEEFPQREGQPIPSSFCSGRTAEAHPGKESAHHVGDPGPIPELGRSPEKGMAPHFSILAWRIPRTE